jgi:uncharacterized SAM-binding protein YcdF (DUF218 family)
MKHVTVLKIIRFSLIALVVWTAISAFDILAFSKKNQLVKTDTAIVLGTAVWNGEPSPVLKERINHAVWLYENGYVENIIFTGGRTGSNKLAESEVSRVYAIQQKVDPDDIYIETESKITEQNFKYANKVADKQGFQTFTVVSDPLHMKRAMVMATDVGMQGYTSPTQTSAFKSMKTKVPFFLRELFFYNGYMFLRPFR